MKSNRDTIPAFVIPVVNRYFLVYVMILHIYLLQSEHLVGLLLNTIPVSGNHHPNLLSFSHGEYFYSTFKTTINTELLRKVDITVPLLMKASSENPNMVNIYPSFCFFKMCCNISSVLTMVVKRQVRFCEFLIRSICC